jgi:solute carrier family 35 protein F1/2
VGGGLGSRSRRRARWSTRRLQAASTALERSGVALPSWQTFFAYLLLACAFAPRYGKRVARAERGAGGYDWQKARKYALCALVDVEANYCVTLAFKYTSMTSVSLLDSATIPFAMVLSKALLGSVYVRRARRRRARRVRGFDDTGFR